MNKTDDDINNNILKKVVTGTSLVFIGLIISMFLNFLARSLIARYWTESEFGIFSIAFSILTICTVISTLGLKQGLSRNIALRRGKKDYDKIRVYISSSIVIGSIVSITAGIIVFLLADFISFELFNSPELATPLRIISIGIPFFTMIEIIISIFRGFDQVKETVYYEHIIISFTLFSLILLAIFLDQSFINVFYALVASYVITLILLVSYSIKKIKSIKFIKIKKLFYPASKELVFFSIPLLGTAILHQIITWTDTLMLGGIKTSADVGLYNVSHLLAKVISFPLGAILIIFIPVFSVLYAQDRFKEMKLNFKIITKWLCSLTLPLFIFFFLFPEDIITFLFGAEYVFASFALRILSIGFILNNFSGPCGVTLVTIGRSRFVMFATLLTAILNIILNIILIPVYGIIGAAFASVFSLISINIIKNLKLYSLAGIHPISKNLVKPTSVFLILILTVYLFFGRNFKMTFTTLIFTLFAFYLIYLLIFILTKSIDKEDVNLINVLEDKSGRKMKKLKKFLNKFT